MLECVASAQWRVGCHAIVHWSINSITGRWLSCGLDHRAASYLAGIGSCGVRG